MAADLGRRLVEVPVGFKWFVAGLLDGTLGFGGEESAGASFLRRDGGPWSTDKDGLIPCLLAAEMTAAGAEPGTRYRSLADRFGDAAYKRVDVAASAEDKAILARLSPEQVTADELAGEPITEILTRAPGNDAPIGGLKVVTESGWFAARPSGTEAVYKVYAESLRGEEHLERILAEAEGVVRDALRRRRRESARRLHHRPGRRRGQAADAADARPREAGRAVRRRLPADRLRALEPGQRRPATGSSC